MKQFLVFLYNEKNEYDFAVRDARGDRNIKVASVHKMPPAPRMPHQMEEPNYMYLTDTEEDAKQLINSLINMFPNTSWGYAETRAYVRHVIVETKTQHMSVTKKGILPCVDW